MLLTRAELEIKLGQLKGGLEQAKANLQAQQGAIDIIELILRETAIDGANSTEPDGGSLPGTQSPTG